MDKGNKTKHFIKQPIYPGGNEQFTKDIYSQIKYPQAALEAKIAGIVFLEYDINYQGIVVEVRVLQGIGHGCDEEASRVLKTLKFDVPKTRGIKVLFTRKAKIQFALPKQAPLQPPPVINQVQYNYVSSTTAPENKPKPEATYNYQIILPK